MSGSAEPLHPVQREKINWVDLHSRASLKWTALYISVPADIHFLHVITSIEAKKELKKQSRTKKTFSRKERERISTIR